MHDKFLFELKIILDPRSKKNRQHFLNKYYACENVAKQIRATQRSVIQQKKNYHLSKLVPKHVARYCIHYR